MAEYSCYLLHNAINNTTYNGSTNNLGRRVRQHNGLISGGAKATKPMAGNWKYLAIITSEPPLEHSQALSLEWHIRYPTGRKPRPRSFAGPEGRLEALCLSLVHPKFAELTFKVSIDPVYRIFLEKSSIPPNSTWGLIPQGPT